MKRINVGIIISLLSVGAMGQALNCDSTCIAPVNVVQNKARTVYGNNNGTYTQSQVLGCPSGYSGAITQSRLVSVYNGSLGYGAWTTTSNTCKATTNPQQCPNGYQPNNTINEIDGTIIYGCIPIQTN